MFYILGISSGKLRVHATPTSTVESMRAGSGKRQEVLRGKKDSGNQHLALTQSQMAPEVLTSLKMRKARAVAEMRLAQFPSFWPTVWKGRRFPCVSQREPPRFK